MIKMIMSDEREKLVKYARNENQVDAVIAGSGNSNVSRDLIIELSVKIVR